MRLESLQPVRNATHVQLRVNGTVVPKRSTAWAIVPKGWYLLQPKLGRQRSAARRRDHRPAPTGTPQFVRPAEPILIESGFG